MVKGNINQIRQSGIGPPGPGGIESRRKKRRWRWMRVVVTVKQPEPGQVDRKQMCGHC